MHDQFGTLKDGTIRVWRHQRVLWWLFFANAVLAAMGTFPASLAVAPIANHSRYAERLLAGFDLSAFTELAGNPDVHLWSNAPGSFLFAFLFFVFALFLNGGVLEIYRLDRKLTAGEFFQACGAFFWRWMRLLVCMLVVLAPVMMLGGSIHKWSRSLTSDAPQEKLGFWVEVGGMLVVLFLLMSVRLWFDMAQVQTVAERERSVLRVVFSGFRLTLRNFGSLFWLYFRISVLAWLGLGAGLWVWSKLAPSSVGTSYAVWELVLLWWTATRLWQRASETAWYQRRGAEQFESGPTFTAPPMPLSMETPPV